MVKFLSSLIYFYQRLVSPLLGPHCRFYPSCSSYFLQALETHGAAKGFVLGIKRVGRCHPLNEGGMDPVPAASCTHQHSKNTLPVLNSQSSRELSSTLPDSFSDKKETQLRHGY